MRKLSAVSSADNPADPPSHRPPSTHHLPSVQDFARLRELHQSTDTVSESLRSDDHKSQDWSREEDCSASKCCREDHTATRSSDRVLTSPERTLQADRQGPV